MPVQNVTPTKCSCSNRRGGIHIDLTNINNYMHGLTCSDMSGSIINRHDKITKLLESYAMKIEGVDTRYNKTTYNIDSPENHHRADLYIKIPDAPEIIIDTKIINISAPSYFKKSIDANLRGGEYSKIQTYKKTLGSDVYNPDKFVPFVLDITGNLGKKGTELINKLAKLAKNYPKFQSHFNRDLSMLLAKEVAESILHFNFRRTSSRRTVTITSSTTPGVGSDYEARTGIIYPLVENSSSSSSRRVIDGRIRGGGTRVHR